MSFLLLVAAAALLAGAVASVAGFGIGSLLTPLLAQRLGVPLAVSLVAIPHFVATVLRAWRLRREIDRGVLVRFGIASAAGGLAGALLHGRLESRAMGLVFAGLLIFAGTLGITGLNARLRFGRRTAWLAGIVSGGFGGLVGNQGGLRSAALLGFDVKKEAFVATATAIGVVVDLVRLPVYLARDHRAVLEAWPLVAAASAAVVIGTLLGEGLLRRLPERLFRILVSTLILALGGAVLFGLLR